MSTPFLKLLSAFVATLSLALPVVAVPIPISSPTAIAFITSLTVVPSSLILLLAAKYFYVKNRKADASGGHTHSSSSSSQLRTLHHLGQCFLTPDWTRHKQHSWLVCSVPQIGRLRGKNQNTVLLKKQTHVFRTLPFLTRAGSVESHPSSFLSVGRRTTPYFTCQEEKPSMFERLGRASRVPGLRIPPVAHSASPPDQSFFYALDTPASSTQSSLGNLLPESALVRLVSQNQLAELPNCPSKSPIETPTPAQDFSTSPSSFTQATPEVKSPPKAKRCTLLRRAPPIPPFLPIQTPPESPILIEPRESSPNENFVFHLHTQKPPIVHRRISHPYAQSPVDPPASAASEFPRPPSQEFHSCNEQSPGTDPGHYSSASSSMSPAHHICCKGTPNGKSPSPSLLVNPGGGSPFFASTSGNQGLTIPRPASTSHTEDSLSVQSPNPFVSRSTSAISGAKLVPFSASARASVISESPSYTSEHAYQGGTSPTVPYELEEYYDYVGPEGVFPVSGGTESPPYRDGSGQATSPSNLASCTGGSTPEPCISGIERKSSFCVPGALFSIPEEDAQAESSGYTSRSNPSSSSNGSVGATAAGSPLFTSASGYREFAASFVSMPGSFRLVNHSTPGASGAGTRPAHRGTGSPLFTSTPAQATLRGTGFSATPSPNVGTLRVGARESYPGSGDLNDRTEMSGACMNGLYEELEEWGCEWVFQNQQRTSPLTGRT